MCLLGDFDVDTYSHNTASRQADEEEFSNTLQVYSYKQLINRTTRLSCSNSSLLDNIYTNINVSIVTCHSGILCADISDHFPVFCILNQLNVIREFKYSTKNIMDSKMYARSK